MRLALYVDTANMFVTRQATSHSLIWGFPRRVKHTGICYLRKTY